MDVIPTWVTKKLEMICLGGSQQYSKMMDVLKYDEMYEYKTQNQPKNSKRKIHKHKNIRNTLTLTIINNSAIN